MQTYQNLIDGQWTGAAALDNINPSDTGDVVGRSALASADETRQAIAAAKAAFPRWAHAGPRGHPAAPCRAAGGGR